MGDDLDRGTERRLALVMARQRLETWERAAVHLREAHDRGEHRRPVFACEGCHPEGAAACYQWLRDAAERAEAAHTAG